MSFNYGVFRREKGYYFKRVVFSKAVLWKDRQLSLRKDIMERILKEGMKKIVFQDDLKGEKWTFSVKRVVKVMKLKKVGQEEQYYFSIDIAKKELLPKKPVVVFDEAREVFVEVDEPQKKEEVIIKQSLFE